VITGFNCVNFLTRRINFSKNNQINKQDYGKVGRIFASFANLLPTLPASPPLS